MTSASPAFSPPVGRLARRFLLNRLLTGLRFRPLRSLLRGGGAGVVPPGEGEHTNNYLHSRKCVPHNGLRRRLAGVQYHILSARSRGCTPTGRALHADRTGGHATRRPEDAPRPATASKGAGPGGRRRDREGARERSRVRALRRTEL